MSEALLSPPGLGVLEQSNLLFDTLLAVDLLAQPLGQIVACSLGFWRVRSFKGNSAGELQIYFFPRTVHLLVSRDAALYDARS